VGYEFLDAGGERQGIKVRPIVVGTALLIKDTPNTYVGHRKKVFDAAQEF
jgi:hypothetical protein